MIYQQKLKEQSQTDQLNIETSEMLDLKTELVSLKNKSLQQDQKRIQEITSKNLQISQLEKKFKEEQQARVDDAE